MKKWNGYDNTQVMGEKRKLPVGGYVCRILEAKEEVYSWGSVLVINFDIEEGEHKNFYRMQYEKQSGTKKWKGSYRLNCPKDNGDEKDEKLKKSFKTFIHHIEKSNAGYAWDWNEASLKGKLFGGVFGEKEYEIEGNTGFFTTLRYTTDKESAKTAIIPKPLLLKKGGGLAP
ncbi:MAG: hypothetical protein ACRDDX_15540, partial [Cellulosilyticaceae bacterium]